MEDDALDGERALECLQHGSEGLGVLLVSNGREAPKWLHARSSVAPLPRVVLLHLHSPDISGLDVLRGFRALARTALPPVVVFSSSADLRAVEECCRAAANSYVVKPAGFEEYIRTLSQTVQCWLRTNRPPPGF